MMKNRLFGVLVVVLGLTAAAVSAPAQSGKMATVDLKKLFDNYWKTKQANNNLMAQKEEILKERNALAEKLKKSEEEYKKLLESANDPVVSAEERDKRKKTAETKLVELRQIESTAEQFLRNAQGTLQETEARMRNNLVKELKEAITVKAKSAGYSLVIDGSADTPIGTPIFLYNTLEDITEILTAELNAKAPPGALDEKPRTPPAAGGGEPKKDAK